jgi:hypothetical protein
MASVFSAFIYKVMPIKCHVILIKLKTVTYHSILLLRRIRDFENFRYMISLTSLCSKLNLFLA